MLQTAKIIVSAKLKTYPWLFLPIALLRENFKRRAVTPKTDIVIDGYWRCGNHYATYSFIFAQHKRAVVAHHFHAPSQFMLAIRWGIPAVLLIRDPIDAVASATIYLNRTDPRPLLRFFNIFHKSLLHLRDQIIVADFPTTVNDFGSVIKRVNDHYQRDFMLYRRTHEDDEKIAKMIRKEHKDHMGGKLSTLPLPSKEKMRLKQQIVRTIDSSMCSSLLSEARRLYQKFQSMT